MTFTDKEVPELKASCDTIRRAASDLIVKIDEKIAELTQGQEKNRFAEIDQWIAEHADELPFDNPGVNHPVGYIEITPPVDMSSLKAGTPLAITVEDPAESKEDNTPDSKQDEKDKPEKKKSVKKQISDKKEKAAKTAKPKKVDTKNLEAAI